jgi:phosphatidate cytidylyltransferase
MNRKGKSNDSKIEKSKAVREDDFFNEFSEDESHAPAKKDTNKPKKADDAIVKKNMLTRAKTGFLIFGFFVLINMLGHFYCAMFIYAIQIAVFREILSIKRNFILERPVRVTSYLLWYIFIVGTLYIFFLYFSDKLYYTNHATLTYILTFKTSIFFFLYIIGFVSFVMTLKIGYIRYQIRLFIETHIVIIISISTSGGMVTIYEGQIWWIMSAIAVILNDTCAYQVGVVYGKTKLIDLSPSKTVEGFLGGMIGSLLVIRIVTLKDSLYYIGTSLQVALLSSE